MSKQSCTGVLSSIIMLVNSEWRPAFRHQCYFVGWKALLQTTIIFWLLAILCWLMLLLIFTISFFQTLSESSLIISGPRSFFTASASHLKCTAFFYRLNLMTITSAIWKPGSSKKQVQNFITHKPLQSGLVQHVAPLRSPAAVHLTI